MGLLNEGVMFGEFFFSCAFVGFRIVHGNGCVSECLYNALLVRRLWTVEKDV